MVLGFQGFHSCRCVSKVWIPNFGKERFAAMSRTFLGDHLHTKNVSKVRFPNELENDGVYVKTRCGRENRIWPWKPIYVRENVCKWTWKNHECTCEKTRKRENGVYGRPSRFSGTFLSDAHAHLEKSMIFSFSTTSLSKLFTFVILAPDECLVLSV